MYTFALQEGLIHNVQAELAARSWTKSTLQRAQLGAHGGFHPD